MLSYFSCIAPFFLFVHCLVRLFYYYFYIYELERKERILIYAIMSFLIFVVELCCNVMLYCESVTVVIGCDKIIRILIFNFYDKKHERFYCV